MHDGWCGFGISRVIPTECVDSLQTSASGPTDDGVLGYAREGGPIADMFEHYCTRSLCAESWDFIVAACKYEVRLYILTRHFMRKSRASSKNRAYALMCVLSWSTDYTISTSVSSFGVSLK